MALPAGLTRLRAICLAFPEVTETASWGHPNFRAGKKTFVAYETWQGRPSIAFRLGQAEVAELATRRNYFETPYGRGRWVSMWTDTTLSWKTVERLAERSYRTVALKRLITLLDSTPTKR